MTGYAIFFAIALFLSILHLIKGEHLVAGIWFIGMALIDIGFKLYEIKEIKKNE